MRARLDSFRHAFRGGLTLLRTQPNARIHAIATVAVIALGWGLSISSLEWLALIFAITLVWLTEALNTAIEFLADEVTTEWRERIKHAKDVSAFAVLVSALAAVAIGIAVFIPHLVH